MTDSIPGVFDHGIIWMTEAHQLVCTVPVDLRDRSNERKIRQRLLDGVEARFPVIEASTKAVFLGNAAVAPLEVFEDAEHGIQYGVVLHRAKEPVS